MLTLVFTLLLGSILWQWMQTESLQTVAGQTQRLHTQARYIRWSIIIVIALLWPKLCDAMAGGRWIAPNNLNARKALRPRIVLWLVILELVIGQGLAQHIAGHLFNHEITPAGGFV